MYVLGMDIGYSNLKIVAGSVDLAPLIVDIMPVGAEPVDEASKNIWGKNNGIEVMVDGRGYIAGIEPDQLASGSRILHEDYSASAEYRALFYAALKKTGRDQIDCLVTGLPVSHFKNEEMRTVLEKRLCGTHEISPGQNVCVKEVKVLPQPAGSYFDVVMA